MNVDCLNVVSGKKLADSVEDNLLTGYLHYVCLLSGTNVSEEHAASIFRLEPEDRIVVFSRMITTNKTI
jgi:hypothetical protein